MSLPRLLIVSAMPHHRQDGRIVGWAPTVRELDHLATRFASVRHIACVYDGAAPASAIPYSAANLEVVPVPPSGAEGALGKLDVLRTSPRYVAAILRELPAADVVHVRGPAHIALIAMLILTGTRRPRARWFKYAGNWMPDGHDSPSYAFQRWWLRRWHVGAVTVNGRWDAQPAWIRPFENPSLDAADLVRGREVGAAKELTRPLRMLFVGQVTAAKGALRAIEVLARVGAGATLEMIGDGAQRAACERAAAELGVDVAFRGWQSPAQVREAYERAHVLVLPTAGEGWPKVLSEGMAYGVVPLAGAVSAIPQYLARFGTGHALAPEDVDGFAAAIRGYIAAPDEWRKQSRRALEASRLFSYDHYLQSVDQLLHDLGVT